jgi:hypothetical protein
MTVAQKMLIELLGAAPCESESEGKPGSCPNRKMPRPHPSRLRRDTFSQEKALRRRKHER